MKLSILHTNDTHSYLGDFAKRAYLIERLKERHRQEGIATLLLGTGDIFSGDIYFNLYHGKLEAEMLNRLQYDAMTLGNHDFDGGSPLLGHFMEQLDFPVISSNIDFSGDPLLAPHAQSKQVRPYQYLELQGKRVALFGLTTLETLEKGDPSPELRFLDPFEVAQKMVQQFQKDQVDIVILLSHLGDDVDRELAQHVSGIDIIVGGHTHIVTEHAIRVQDTLIVQAGHYGEFLGELLVEWSDGRLLSYQETMHEIAASPQDPDSAIYHRIEELKAEMAEKTSRVVATIPEAMVWDRKQLDHFQSALGNLVSDAFYQAAQDQGYKVDAAIMNGGGIRTSLDEGPLTYEELIQLLPFSKQLMVIQVTGAKLIQALEQGLYPQVSHLEVTYQGDSDADKKIQELVVIRDGKREPVEKEALYCIATNSFVGVGKDQYTGFKGSQVLAMTELSDVDVLERYLASRRGDQMPRESRIHWMSGD